MRLLASNSDAAPRCIHKFVCVLFMGTLVTGAAACSSSSQTTERCELYERPEFTRDDSRLRSMLLDLDCDGLVDTVLVEREEVGANRGLPKVIVARGGRTVELRLQSDVLPEIVDAGDISGDGVIDILLSGVSESVTIWPLLVITSYDTLLVPTDMEEMGVYYFDELTTPECSSRELLPFFERDRDGRLVISWPEVTVTTQPPEPPQPETDCASPRRLYWEYADGAIRLRL